MFPSEHLLEKNFTNSRRCALRNNNSQSLSVDSVLPPDVKIALVQVKVTVNLKVCQKKTTTVNSSVEPSRADTCARFL